MATTSRQIRSAKRIRILLICPLCGQEGAELVETLRGLVEYACRGEGCDYRFRLKTGADNELADGFAKTYAKLNVLDTTN
jgi:hypothetical protein